MLERLDGEFASADDLTGCSNALRRLHEIGMIHGDVNRYNFVVDRQSRRASMVDFEHAAALDEVVAEGNFNLWRQNWKRTQGGVDRQGC